MSLLSRAQAVKAFYEDALSALPDWRGIAADPSLQQSLAQAAATASNSIYAARGVLDTALECEAPYDRKTTDHKNANEIREELAQKLLTAAVFSDFKLRQSYTISIKALDGRFDLTGEAVPEFMPLFDLLRARGYTGTVDQPWNPLASIGTLPRIEETMKQLKRRLDQAEAGLRSITPPELMEEAEAAK